MITETEQTWENLVWAKKPCPESHIAHRVCRVCNENSGDAGKVLVLPDLSEVCPCLAAPATMCCPDCLQYGAISHGHSPGGLCSRCPGTGRVPKPMHLETLFGAMRRAGFDWIYAEKVYVFYLSTQFPVPDQYNWQGYHSVVVDGNDLAAAAEAAWKAVEESYADN